MDRPPGLSIFLLIFFSLAPATDQNVRQKRDVVTAQPRLITQSGHLIFQTGDNHNITFRSSTGGSINVDGEDLKASIQIVKINKAQVEDLVRKNTAVQSRLSNVENSVSTINQIQNTLNTLSTQITALSSRVANLESNSGSPSPSDCCNTVPDRVDDVENRPMPTSPTSQPNNNNNNNYIVRRLRARVSTLETQVQQLQRVANLERQMRRLNRLLTRNECASNPCQNGGTCVDLYNGYTCRCPSAWQGTRCNEDVNECATLAGTDMGCQNGATCTNTIGSFRCTCTANYRGIRCTETHQDCTGASAQELCGHGTCVNVPRTNPNLPKYDCICEDGWTKDSGSNPACVADINECDSNNPPCSSDPPVQCINLPGTFHCGNCPVGYTGNGFTCSDVNECLINNGGCSQTPLVQCINTRGSSVCGQCPAGYQGNGQVCLPVSGGVCSSNNGGCHPVASCVENAAVVEGRTCHCPPGYQGSGIGPSGCVAIGTVAPGNPCFNNPCGSNGQCQVNGNTYQCICNPGWSGSNCQVNINECASSPCQNGGTCVDGVNRFQCQCPSTHTGTTCQTPVGCGVALTGETGSLSFPVPNGQEYPHGVSCAWTITTTVNKVINVQFTRFDIEYHQNCDYDFLQIHDGLTASAYQIGKFCGNRAPLNGTFNSTHHQLYFWFRSDGSVAGHGFALQWTTMDPYCGGVISNRTHGSIQSPGYPGNYPHNRDCVWTIAVATTKKILFTFGTLALEHHDNCSYDFLELRDGLLETDPLLGRYCSTSEPAPIRTTGPVAQVRFHSDESLSDRGFHITYSEVDGPVTCGGDYTSGNGVIISPNYPNPYNHNDQCIWTVTVPVTEVITLTFTNMDLEAHSNCQFDYVEVRDGGNEYADLVGRYCGTQLPATFVSSINRLWVKFKSDVSNRGSGFRATWNVACGGRFTTPTGSLHSPYFPGNYPNEKECIYIIAQPRGTRITLTFQNFDIEAGNNDNCNYDYLEVRDGSGPEANLIGRYCGNAVPAPVTSSANNMWLKFKSDGSVQNHGFLATYETTDTGTDCGGSLTGQAGSFHSPGHPNVYPHGVNCTWTITVDPGYIVRLTFLTFSMEADANCRYDYVELFDSGNETSPIGNSLGRYCGSTMPPARQSRENSLTVVLVTDSSVSHEGFAASYVALNGSVSCHYELTDLVGVITSPGWPGGYPHQKTCEWTISVPQDHQIQLNITDFQLEQHANCDYDYLEIRNGGYVTSPLIGTYCGTTIDNPIRSHSNRMYLKFKSDVSQTAPGFRIFYDGSSTGCGGILTTPSGSLTSPNYPAAYGHNAECYWIIQVAEGSTIQLMFLDFDIEAHTSCAYDYVEIRESDANGARLARYCGGQTPQGVSSRTNQMWIKMRTDYSNSGRGFLAGYNALCNTRLTARRGAIESPNFPQPYPHARECTWVIEATLGNTVNISFSHLDIEAHGTCNYDYVEIRDGQDENANSLGKFCGQNVLPPAMASSGQYLWVKFKSDASVASNGFRLEWVMNGCGDDLSGDTGSFSSPGYPNPYPHRQVCIWTITVPTGKSVELTISDFDLESHSSCNYDVLEVFGGVDDTAPRLTQLCHTQTDPQVVQSTGNKMFIRFKSDVSVNGRGFTATYLSKDGGCGGNYTTPTATIMSANYPNNYPSTTDCLYKITVQPNRVVQLTFEDFDVETHSNCSYDYVALYDGPDVNSPQIMIHCGNALPSPVTYRSSSNQMTVRMKSDGSITAKGFKATYVTGCGGMLSAETDGAITSPNYPNAYDHNSNCSWIITTDQPTARVTLIFTHMDLEDYANCSADYVMVADGNNANAPVLGTYCGTRIPPAITSFSGALYVQFVSDQSVGQSGFRAIYSKSSSFCGGDLTSQQGAFNSPGYPDNYPRETECIWTITASPGNRIQLAFSMFNLENHYLCNYDYVEIRDGGVSGDLVGRYCGTNTPSNLTASNSLWIKFRSNQANNGQGFMAEYTTVYGGQISGSSGQVASPMYPSPYPHNTEAAWVITVPLGQVVRVAFDVLDLETSGTCYFDYVQFRDGGAADAPQIGKYCGTTAPSPFTSTGNQLYVAFKSDASSTGQGFLFNWQAVSTVITTPSPTQATTPVPGCGGELSASEVANTVVSPGYPSGYVNRLNCVWTIRSTPGYKIWFNITFINLEAHSACNYDKLVLYDNDAAFGRVLGTFCGRQPNTEPVIATSNVMTAKFTTDSSVTRTGFAASYKTTCGGVLDGPTGVIQSPSYPNSYPNNANCTWVIRVTNGRTISVEFDTFNIQSTSSCSGDGIMLLNGDNSGSPPLGNDASGKYCGTTAPANINTTSNRMYINFYSDGSGSSQGFKLIFREVSVTCGGRLTLTNDVRSGFVTSPNYPQPYPHNVDCIWVITAPSTDQVQLDFVDEFNIEQHSQCQYDYVRVRDGGTENGPELGTFCGRTRPSTVHSTGNIMYVRFRTDDSVPRTGFKARYQISTCGGTINADSGSIMSPNYPDPYGNDANCEWFVNGPTGHYLTFTFEAFNLQQSDNCVNNDYLQIRDLNRTGPILGFLCGTSLPAPVRTSDSFAYLQFKTDRATTAQGFKVNFEASVEGCGGELNTPTGVITSPNYPGSYPHSRTCTWLITVAPGRRVSLEFTDVNIEAHSRCRYDYIQVYNGIMRESPSLGYFCGTTNPGIMKSSGNTMKVEFVTDGSVTNGGFRAQYTSQEPIKCGGTITNANGASGTLMSPGFQNGNYSNDEQCVWVLTNTNGGYNSSIGLRFTAFALEEHGSCNYDYLEIREGTDQTGTLLGRYCGNTTIPPRMVTPSPYLWVMFRTDHSIVDTGFSLDYNFTRCGGVLLSQQGVITSPNYPNNYDHFDQCGWEILAPDNYQIIVEVTNMNIEDHDKCQYDYLEIFNGGTASSPSIGKFCGSSPPESFRSQSNRLRIEFHADSSVSASGFRLTYRMDGGGCGGTLHGKKGYISSPNYPNRYPHNVECMWEINTDPGYHVLLDFNSPFDLENAGNCIYDYVEVSDYIAKNDSWIPITRYCHNEIPPSIRSVSNRLLVKFHSNSAVNGNGFSASWEAGCGALFTQDTGIILSPGFPGNYENNLTCNYTIMVDPQKFVLLTFDEENFNIEGGTGCPYDYVAAYTGNGSDSNLLGKFCGTTAPAPVSSLGVMFIQFVTDSSIVARGYRATYSAMECGGVYTAPQGTIRTPQHPVNYHHNANCTWSITVQPDRVVELKFNIFDIETHSSCNYDYVDVRDGNSLTSPLIGRFCSNVIPEPVRTTGNTMTVNFVSDASINGAGFTASYRTTFGVPLCGGFLNGTQGRFGSFDIDGDGLYEDNLNCVWQIVGQDNKVLNLTFEPMDIEADNTCDYDYLEVRDGLTSDDPLVGKYCGSRPLTYFVSSSNMVYIKFYTDGSVGGRGFNISYRQVDALCGGVRTATTSPQTISSPNYPNSYPHNLRCRWTIDAGLNQQIDVNVTDFNVENHANCQYDYLELRDKPLGDNGQILMYCGSQLPPLFTSKGRTMQINFVTDASATAPGFSLTYQVASCNRTHSGSTGRVTSPGWPGRYPSYSRCYVVIQSPPGTYLSLYFNSFYIEPHTSCNFDYLEIRNGSDASAGLVGKYCGNTLPDPVFATGNSIWMFFLTDNSVTHPGYDITFASSSSAPGCGGTFKDSYGSFTSPLYPQPYTNNRNCTWLVQVPARKVVTITFTAFNIEYHDSCNYDWVDVYDGPSTSSTRVGRYCGDSMPAEFTASGRAVTIFFRSDQSQTGPGFRIAYSSSQPALMQSADKSSIG